MSHNAEVDGIHLHPIKDRVHASDDVETVGTCCCWSGWVHGSQRCGHMSWVESIERLRNQPSGALNRKGKPIVLLHVVHVKVDLQNREILRSLNALVWRNDRRTIACRPAGTTSTTLGQDSRVDVVEGVRGNGCVLTHIVVCLPVTWLALCDVLGVAGWCRRRWTGRWWRWWWWRSLWWW